MRTIYVSSGHSNNPKSKDRGAVGNGFIEGELTVEFRNLLVQELTLRGVKAIVDKDDSILSQSIKFFRNLTTNSCIVLDIHWNAASASATGTETLIPSQYTPFELDLAEALSRDVAETLDIPLRGNTSGRKGVKTEAQSHHGRLGWMRLTGENVLMEICFISNPADMSKYQRNKQKLAKRVASTLINFALRGSNNQQPVSRPTYTVVAGDSLWSISQRFNTTVQELQRKNNLVNGRIIPGQKLSV